MEVMMKNQRKTERQLKKVCDYIASNFPSANGFYIAGGAIRDLLTNQPVNDYDIFFRSHKKAIYFLKHYMEDFKSQDMSLCSVTQNAITIQLNKLDNIKIQFIYKKEFCNPPFKTINRFDFTHSMAFFEYNVLYCDEKMQTAINTKQIIFNPMCHTPFTSIKRMFKFLRRGWSISIRQFIAVMLHGLTDYKNYDKVKVQYTGGY